MRCLPVLMLFCGLAADVAAREVAVLNVAVGQDASDLVVLRVNGDPPIELAYRATAQVNVEPGDQLSVVLGNGAQTHDGPVDLNSDTALLIVSGGTHGHPLAVAGIDGDAGFTDLNPAGGPVKSCPAPICLQVLNFAPVSGRHPQFGGPEVGLELRCRSVLPGGAENSARSTSRIAYGEFAQLRAGATAAPMACDLNGVAVVGDAQSWPDRKGILVDPRRSTRTVLIGDGRVHPREVVVLIERNEPNTSTVLLPPAIADTFDLPRVWVGEFEAERRLVLESLGDGELWVGVEFFRDESGAPRWLSFVAQRDSRAAGMRFFGLQYRSTRIGGEVSSLPVADIELNRMEGLMDVTLWGEERVVHRYRAIASDD